MSWVYGVADKGESITAIHPAPELGITLFDTSPGVDGTSVECAANLHYAIPNLAVELTTTESPCRSSGGASSAAPIRPMRSRPSSTRWPRPQVKIPYRFRRALLAHQPRHRTVLDLAAEKAGWSQPLPKGRGRGIAVAEAFNTYVAQVAEVTVGSDGGSRSTA
jgi:isoquinoline 1-oxidoreductase subunit beta